MSFALLLLPHNILLQIACNSETLTVGDRVVDEVHGAGTVLGFRKQNGDEIGDTSGALLFLNGCVRIKFDIRGEWNTTNTLHFENKVRPCSYLASEKKPCQYFLLLI
jgi:hypothetical protein